MTRAIAFRKAHPSLRPGGWYTPAQVVWYYSNAAPVSNDPTRNSYWNGANNYLAAIITFRDFDDSNLVRQFIMAPRPMPAIQPLQPDAVHLTARTPGKNWYRVTDTCEWNDGPDVWAAPGNETFYWTRRITYRLCGQALALFIAK